MNNPINIAKGQGRSRSKKKSIDLNKQPSHKSAEMEAYYKFIRGPMIQGPYSSPGQGSVDLFDQHYAQKSHPPLESGKNAFELYECHQNRNIPDLNNAMNIPVHPERKKSKTKDINLNKSACHESAEMQAFRDFVKRPITQLGSHSPLRDFEDNEEITPEQLKKHYESLELYHEHYGYPKDPSYSRLLEGFSKGSSSNSKNQ